MRISPDLAGWVIWPDGSVSREPIDLAWPAKLEILIWHGDDPAFPAGGTCAIERMPMPSPGTSWDLSCPDCASEVVTFLGAPAEAAAAAFGVAHSRSCPWLADVVRDGAA